MRHILDDHRAAMDESALHRQLKIILEGWDCHYAESSGPIQVCNLFEQQSSPRGAAAAALTLNIFINRCAHIARLCNNLHSFYIARGGRFAEASPAMSLICARAIRAADSCMPASAVL